MYTESWLCKEPASHHQVLVELISELKTDLKHLETFLESADIVLSSGTCTGFILSCI